mgnify:CR=1 FL=1
MTREEAIKILNNVSFFAPSEINVDKAIDMAIEALENKPTPCEKCIHVKSCRKVIILKNRTYKLIKYCSQGAERREP